MKRIFTSSVVSVMGLAIIAAPVLAKGKGGGGGGGGGSSSSRSFSSSSSSGPKLSSSSSFAKTSFSQSVKTQSFSNTAKLNTSAKLSSNAGKLKLNQTQSQNAFSQLSRKSLTGNQANQIKKLGNSGIAQKLGSNLNAKALRSANAPKMTALAGNLAKKMQGSQALKSIVKDKGKAFCFDCKGKKCDACCYPCKDCCHWSHCCYSHYYSCHCYYDPCWCCYYYWCEHDCCWYPISYRCPHCFPTLVVVEQPVVVETAVPVDPEVEALQKRSLSDIPVMEDGDRLIEKSLGEPLPKKGSLGKAPLPME